MHYLFRGYQALTEDTPAPEFDLEYNPVIRVLRWMGFVKSDEEIWLANTRKWEQETGGTVITVFIYWEDNGGSKNE